jgi:hypothetical protein
MGTETKMQTGFKEQLVLVHDQVTCVAGDGTAWHCHWFIIMHHFSLSSLQKTTMCCINLCDNIKQHNSILKNLYSNKTACLKLTCSQMFA